MYKVNLLKVAGILTCVVALGLYLQNAFDGYGVLKMESLHPHLVAQTNTGSTGGYTCWSCGGYGDCTVCWGKHDYCVGDCSYGECTCSPPSGNDCLENRSGGSGYKVSKTTRCSRPCQNYYAITCDGGNQGCSPSDCKENN